MFHTTIYTNGKKIFGILVGMCAFTQTLNASGFRLGEQSLNSTALNSAYIAGAYGADSTYYNPANMSLGRDSDKWEFEFDGSLIIIPGFSFDTENRDKGTKVGATLSGCAKPNACPARVDGKANTTVYPVPKFFFKSRSYKLPFDMTTNFGASLTTPSGLSMDWDGIGGGFLDNVSIAMIEFNPVVSLAWRDFISFAIGFRTIYSFGNFNNTLYVPYEISALQTSGTTRVQQTSDSKGFGFGYNMAFSVKPFELIDLPSDYELLKNMMVSFTYRAKTALNTKGSLSAVSFIDTGIEITQGGSGTLKGTVDMNADLNIMTDLPHIINFAISQDYKNHRLEFAYEHTFWGSARIFEFSYANQAFSNLQSDNPAFALIVGGMLPTMMNAADYSAVAYGNGWKDSNAYRLGYTYFGKTFKIMGSLAYDETPAPQGKFGIPDADAYMFGLGFRKRFFNDKLDIGAGYSLALKDNRKSFIVSHNGFGQLHLLTIGAKYLW